MIAAFTSPCQREVRHIALSRIGLQPLGEWHEIWITTLGRQRGQPRMAEGKRRLGGVKPCMRIGISCPHHRQCIVELNDRDLPGRARLAG